MTVQLLNMGRQVCMTVNTAIYFMVSKYSLILILVKFYIFSVHCCVGKTVVKTK